MADELDLHRSAWLLISEHGADAPLVSAKLGDLLQLKYHTVNDAVEKLGGVPRIRGTFIDFQRYLYE